MDYLTTIRQIEMQQARYFEALARILQARPLLHPAPQRQGSESRG